MLRATNESELERTVTRIHDPSLWHIASLSECHVIYRIDGLGNVLVGGRIEMRSDRSALIDREEEIVRGRLAAHERMSIEDILSASGIPVSRRQRARHVLVRLASILGVEPELLRPTEKLRDVCRVTRGSIPSMSDSEWRHANVGEQVEVFGYDILDAMERISSKGHWKNAWKSLELPPQDEEQWINLIMEMDLNEFLRFFSQTLSE